MQDSVFLRAFQQYHVCIVITGIRTDSPSGCSTNMRRGDRIYISAGIWTSIACLSDSTEDFLDMISSVAITATIDADINDTISMTIRRQMSTLSVVRGMQLLDLQCAAATVAIWVAMLTPL